MFVVLTTLNGHFCVFSFYASVVCGKGESYHFSTSLHIGFQRDQKKRKQIFKGQK